MAPLDVSPFSIEVGDDVLDDLQRRLAATRLPNQVADVGWDQGTDLSYFSDLLGYWRDGFDWRAAEARVNQFPQAVTTVDGQRIHFLHVRSPHEGALPLLLVHGWPGSVVEFLDVLGPLTDTFAHGGSAADAFSVLAPSLPGFGWSGPTSTLGWHPRRIAEAFVSVMSALGYERYGCQGGDWGSIVCSNVADLAGPSGHVAGLHLNFVAVGRPDGSPDELAPEEQAALAALHEWRRHGAGYQEIQGTKPQTLGYALQDSPAGLAAWIVEKFREWSDCDGDIRRSFSFDQLLTNVMAYWVTGTAASSTRIYWEMRRAGRAAVPQSFVSVPTGVANYPAEITKFPRAWVERRYDVTHWVDLPRGGHFAAMEVPDVFVDDVRAFFRTVR